MQKIREYVEVVGVLRYQASCRCFIGKRFGGEDWLWQETNSIAFEIFYEELLELEHAGLILVTGPPNNILITQKSGNSDWQYRAKFFLQNVRVEMDPWDVNLLAAAA